MSLYKNVPPMGDETSIIDLLVSAEKIIKWGEYNLPEINRAKAIATSERLPESSQLMLALALMIRSYTFAMEGWIEASRINPPIIKVHAKMEGKK